MDNQEKSKKAANAMNRWWRKRTGRQDAVADPSGTGDGYVDVKADALFVVVEYARNLSVLAESRRMKLAQLQDDVVTLQQWLFEAGRSDEP